MQKPLLSLTQQISAGAIVPHVTHSPVPWVASEVHLPAATVSPKTAWHHWAQNELPPAPKTLRIAPRPTTPPMDAVTMVLKAWRREVDFASSLVSSSNFVGFIIYFLGFGGGVEGRGVWGIWAWGNREIRKHARSTSSLFLKNNFSYQRSVENVLILPS